MREEGREERGRREGEGRGGGEGGRRGREGDATRQARISSSAAVL